MAMDFPDTPAVDEVFTDATSGASYTWDGTVWRKTSSGSSSSSGSGGTPVDAYTKAEADARFELIGAAYTVAEADARFLNLDGSVPMIGNLQFGADNLGVMFYGMGRITKKSGAGMALYKSSGGQAWQICAADGTGCANITTG